uniref:Uncharacterized protein n=1 Tax=Macrostomum lignano TaxID=282301 RepID=A0A1I8JJH0_9PLAT
MDVHCLRPMDSLVSKETCFFDQERPEQSRILHGVDFAVMNSAIGCVRRHPFLEQVLRNLRAARHNEDIIRTTGPLYLTSQLKLFQRNYLISQRGGLRVLQPHVFSPLPDRSAGLRDISSRLTKHQLTARQPPSTSAQLKLDACQQLVEANSSAWITDRTLAIHRFLHLGYAGHSARHRHRFPVDSLFPLVTTATKTESGVGARTVGQFSRLTKAELNELAS